MHRVRSVEELKPRHLRKFFEKFVNSTFFCCSFLKITKKQKDSQFFRKKCSSDDGDEILATEEEKATEMFFFFCLQYLVFLFLFMAMEFFVSVEVVVFFLCWLIGFFVVEEKLFERVK